MDEFLNAVIVLDSRAPYVYIGTLESYDDMFVTLKDASVHDCAESPITREQHVAEVRRFGLRVSRKYVKIKFSDIVGISRLDDVVVD